MENKFAFENPTVSKAPSTIEQIRQRIARDADEIRAELSAYRLLIQGYEILAELADQRGPGQAPMYRIKLQGYQQIVDQLGRELETIEQIIIA